MTEEQGTGTLHNHMLVWLHNFKSASELKSQLQDASFQEKLIDYLERIIKQGYIDDDLNVQENVTVEQDLDVSEVSCKYAVDPSHFKENPSQFKAKLADDVNKLVTVANTHRHSQTCYKYRNDTECRFGFPRDLVPKTVISDENVINYSKMN